jgi:hypothetical protein
LKLFVIVILLVNEMKKKWFLLVFIPYLLVAQNDTLYEHDIVDEGNILQNYNAPDDYQIACATASLKLYNFSDYIYLPNMIKTLKNPSHTSPWVESGLIEKGAWGRGFFTKLVDSYLFSIGDSSRTNYKTLWNGEGNPIKFYRQTNPCLSYCSKALLFTIYWCKSHSYSEKNLNKIRDGLAYLLNNQQKDGGFVQYWFRTSQAEPAPDPKLNRETPYATGDVLRALVEGYFFIKDNVRGENEEFLNKLENAIAKGGEYLMSEQCFREEGNNNYKCFSIWGLISVYKITGNKKLLVAAVSKYYEIHENQNSDGAWSMLETDPKNQLKTYYDFHDTHPCYMGIILRGLGELYSVLTEDYHFKNRVLPVNAEIKKSICLTVNNFLRLNMRKDSKEPRINLNGTINPYKLETEYVGGAFYGLNLIHGLKYIENCNGSLKLNPYLLSQLIKILIKSHTDQINSIKFADEPNHDDNMVSFGLQLIPNQLSQIYCLSKYFEK